MNCTTQTQKSKPQQKAFQPRPSFLHSVLVNQFSIHPDLRQFLDNYYLLYWSPEWTLSQIKEGTIKHQGETYIVIYGQSTSRGKILEAVEKDSKKVDVAVSFRKAKKEFGIPGYVILMLS